MAVYYVHAGIQQLVVQAENPVRAALWALHQWLAEVALNYEDPGLTESECRTLAYAAVALTVENTISVAEVADQRIPAERVQVTALVEEWHQLMVALTRFQTANTSPQKDTVIKPAMARVAETNSRLAEPESA